MARVEQADNGALKVVLSERNLIALLAKIHTPGSRCELVASDVPEGVPYVQLCGERDEVHYDSETRAGARGYAGAMHPLTEAISDGVRDVVAQMMRRHGGLR